MNALPPAHVVVGLRDGHVLLIWRDFRGHPLEIPFQPKYARLLADELKAVAAEVEPLEETESVGDHDDRLVTTPDGRAAGESPSPSPKWRPISEARSQRDYVIQNANGERVVAWKKIEAGKDRWFLSGDRHGPLYQFSPTHFAEIPDFDGGEG